MARQECDYYEDIISTDEMCIGTVNINGTRKKLYRKLITGTYPTTYASLIYIAHNISNIDIVFELQGFDRETSVRRSFNRAYYGSADWDSCASATDTSIQVQTGSSFFSAVSGKPYYFVITYTKSS